MNFVIFLRTPFLQNTSGGCFCKFRKLEILCFLKITITIKIQQIFHILLASNLSSLKNQSVPLNTGCKTTVGNRNTRTMCEICSKLTIKTPERLLYSTLKRPFPRRSLNFEHISHLVLVFLSLTLSR